MSIRTLADAQDRSVIHGIFSQGATPSPAPQLVILVGAPGVGKTSQIGKLVTGSFYYVSLDRLVEQVQPYRIMTKLVYDEMKKRRPLTEVDYALLHDAYMATARSRDNMFDSSHTAHRILDKMNGIVREKEKAPPSTYHTLIELRKQGLEDGMEQGLDIIYDTTFSSTKNIMKEDILPLLEKQKVTYQVRVIHVTASEEQIRQQLEERHENMVKEGYIRAIGPQRIKKFIRENQEGSEIAERYCMEYHTMHPLTRYTPDRFTFETYENIR